jgi:hypothetical protein
VGRRAGTYTVTATVTVVDGTREAGGGKQGQQGQQGQQGKRSSTSTFQQQITLTVLAPLALLSPSLLLLPHGI